MGIGVVELVILVVIVVVVARAVFVGRGGGTSAPQPHPTLQTCPKCDAPLHAADDFCPNCGLRLAS